MSNAQDKNIITVNVKQPDGKKSVSRQFVRTTVVLLSILTLISFYFFLSRLQLDYNAEGNYFDEEKGVVYHEQAGEVFGLITFSLFILTLLLGFNLRRKVQRRPVADLNQ